MQEEASVYGGLEAGGKLSPAECGHQHRLWLLELLRAPWSIGTRDRRAVLLAESAVGLGLNWLRLTLAVTLADFGELKPDAAALRRRTRFIEAMLEFASQRPGVRERRRFALEAARALSYAEPECEVLDFRLPDIRDAIADLEGPESRSRSVMVPEEGESTSTGIPIKLEVMPPSEFEVTATEVAEAWGVNSTTAREWVKKLGVPVGRQGKSLTYDFVALRRELECAGKGAPRILPQRLAERAIELVRRRRAPEEDGGDQQGIRRATPKRRESYECPCGARMTEPEMRLHASECATASAMDEDRWNRGNRV